LIPTTKVCTNGNCPSYARVLYTGSTRCDFCRWDLKVAQRNIAPAAHADSTPPPRTSVVPSRRETLRHGNL
jgi:hypothetical protein